MRWEHTKFEEAHFLSCGRGTPLPQDRGHKSFLKTCYSGFYPSVKSFKYTILYSLNFYIGKPNDQQNVKKQ